MSDQYIEVTVHSGVAKFNKMMMLIAVPLTVILIAASAFFASINDYDTATPLGLLGLGIVIVALMIWMFSAAISSIIIDMGGSQALKFGGFILLLVGGTLVFFFALLAVLGVFD